MPFTVADGPLGLEGIFTWNGGAAVLNDQSAMPRVELEEIGGLYGKPANDNFRDNRVGRHGQIPRPSYNRDKTPTFSGLVIASSLAELRSYRSDLLAAFEESYLELPMRISPHGSVGGPSWYFMARCIGCDIPERQDASRNASPTPWQRTFTLSLDMSDGRFYLVGGPESAGPFADATTHTVTNQGRAETEPIIAGTITNLAQVTLENLTVTTSNGTARLRFVDLPTGATDLSVNFAARAATVTVDGTDQDAWPFLDAFYSQWTDELIPALVGGANQLKATGLDDWTVQFTSASW
jgi:hypothetical protein